MYKTTEFANLIGVHPITIRRWIYQGKIKPYKTKTGRYYFTEEHLKEFLGQSKDNLQDIKNKNNISKRGIIYGRTAKDIG